MFIRDTSSTNPRCAALPPTCSTTPSPGLCMRASVCLLFVKPSWGLARFWATTPATSPCNSPPPGAKMTDSSSSRNPAGLQHADAPITSFFSTSSPRIRDDVFKTYETWLGIPTIAGSLDFFGQRAKNSQKWIYPHLWTIIAPPPCLSTPGQRWILAIFTTTTGWRQHSWSLDYVWQCYTEIFWKLGDQGVGWMGWWMGESRLEPPPPRSSDHHEVGGLPSLNLKLCHRKPIPTLTIIITLILSSSAFGKLWMSEQPCVEILEFLWGDALGSLSFY